MSDITIPHNYTPRNYQIPLWQYFQEGGKRAAAVWHRRAGKDLFAINWTCTSMMERKGLYWHILPTYNQGRKIVWDGYTKDGRPFLDHFPEELIESKNSTDMRIKLKTGSTYQVVGSDDPDRLVGCNPIGCIFSEYSIQDPAAWDYIRPILAENEGWALFIYTARGRNHGYDMIEMAKKNPKWFAEVLPAGDDGTKRPDGTPVISNEVIQEERDSDMPEEKIQQEFFCSFDAPVTGAYYGHQMMRALEQKRICQVSWEPRIRVDTYWDLGMDDSTVIWFVQQHGMEIRLIDYYENSGEGLAHYAKVLAEKDYVYGNHWAPHDIEVREMGTGKSRRQVAKSLGIRFRVIPKHSVQDGIEAGRNILSRCWFDKNTCERGIEALRQYRKEWNDKMKCWGSHPLHDWASHPSDAFRYMAWVVKDKRKKGGPRQTQADESGYDPLNN